MCSCCWGTHHCAPFHGWAIFQRFSVSLFAPLSFLHRHVRASAFWRSSCWREFAGTGSFWRLSPPVSPGIELPDHQVAWLSVSSGTLHSVLPVALCNFHSLQQLRRLPTSPRPSPAFIAPGCLNDKHSVWWVMIPWCKIQSLLLNLYGVDVLFLGDAEFFFSFSFVYLVWVILNCWDWALERRPDSHCFGPCSFLPIILWAGVLPSPSGFVNVQCPEALMWPS